MERVKYQLGWLILILFCQVSVAATHVLRLHQHQAHEVIPLLQPILDQDARISGKGKTLIIKTSDKNFKEVQQIVGELERPAQSLIISVRRGKPDNYNGMHTLGKTLNRDIQRGNLQRLRVLDGGEGFIALERQVLVVTDFSKASAQQNQTYNVGTLDQNTQQQVDTNTVNVIDGSIENTATINNSSSADANNQTDITSTEKSKDIEKTFIDKSSSSSNSANNDATVLKDTIKGDAINRTVQNANTQQQSKGFDVTNSVNNNSRASRLKREYKSVHSGLHITPELLGNGQVKVTISQQQQRFKQDGSQEVVGDQTNTSMIIPLGEWTDLRKVSDDLDNDKRTISTMSKQPLFQDLYIKVDKAR